MSSELLLSLVDDLLRGDHYHLSADDKCYFLREYTAGAGFSYSATNNLISNLKKSPEKRHLPEYFYKGEAIKQSVNELTAAIQQKWQKFDGWGIVPIPPSKAAAHELHDDRVWQIAKRLSAKLRIPAGKLLVTLKDREALHTRDRKRDVAVLIANIAVDENLATEREFKGLILLDDVLTTGATFVACKTVLKRRLPGVKVIGVFVARRMPDSEWPPLDFFDP